MEEIKFEKPILKVVKKTTHNDIINEAHFNINPENYPIKQKIIRRSQSFKKIEGFVPIIRPKKSTFNPSPLKLNANRNNNIEKKEIEKQLSDEEIQSSDSPSSSSSPSSLCSSSNINDSINEISNEKKKSPVNNLLSYKNGPLSALPKKKDVFFALNEIKEEDEDEKKKMRSFRKKMSHIKIKVNAFKFKETEECIKSNYKSSFDLDLDKGENEEDKTIINSIKNTVIDENEINKNKIINKPISIFDVLSKSGKKMNKLK